MRHLPRDLPRDVPCSWAPSIYKATYSSASTQKHPHSPQSQPFYDTTQVKTRPRHSFLHLPAEVRIKIYEELVPTKERSNTYQGICLLCRQVKKEFEHEVLKHTKAWISELSATTMASIELSTPITFVETKHLGIKFPLPEEATVEWVHDANHRWIEQVFSTLPTNIKTLSFVGCTRSEGEVPIFAIKQMIWHFQDCITNRHFPCIDRVEFQWNVPIQNYEPFRQILDRRGGNLERSNMNVYFVPDGGPLQSCSSIVWTKKPLPIASVQANGPQGDTR